ncbi:hypothetical protein VKT23_006090 [Stygiomarasmius scandens]|uniref:Uncharacterized protein n=1 Tax=Marasmiellus scandens TaxID=2682957 RepID=A0ABR1JV16_9AGAR
MLICTDAQDATTTQNSGSGESLTTVTLYTVRPTIGAGSNEPFLSVTPIGTAEDGSETTYSIIDNFQPSITRDNVIVESASGFRQIVDTQVLDLEATTLPSVLYINLPYDECTFLNGNNEDGTMGVCERTATGSSATSTFTGDVVATATITATVQPEDRDDDDNDGNATQTNGVGGLTRLAVGNLGVLGMMVMIIVNTMMLTM